jgi:hypothetical protein
VNCQVHDAGLWVRFNLEKKITPFLSATLREEVRLNENITEVGEIFTDVGLSYRFLKRFEISANYRFSNKREVDDSYDRGHRYYFDLKYKEKIKKFSILLRMRFISQYTNIYSSETGMVPNNHLTGKVTVKYKLMRRIEPYISTEAFFCLDKKNQSYFDQIRCTAGIEYSFSRMHSVDLYYRICHELNTKNPETDFIIGLSYNLTL